MKIHNIKNIEEFSKVVNTCKGEVQLVSPEGDCLNLKSKLTQYVVLATIIGSPFIKEMELKVELPDDMAKIQKYMLDGTVVGDLTFQ